MNGGGAPWSVRKVEKCMDLGRGRGVVSVGWKALSSGTAVLPLLEVIKQKTEQLR